MFEDRLRGCVSWRLLPGVGGRLTRRGTTLRAASRAVVRGADRWCVKLATRQGGERRMEWRLLEGVAGDELQALLSVARRRTFGRNEVVFHRGDPADSLHLIQKGHFAARVVTPRRRPCHADRALRGRELRRAAVLGDGVLRTATVAALDAGRDVLGHARRLPPAGGAASCRERRARPPARRAGARADRAPRRGAHRAGGAAHRPPARRARAPLRGRARGRS